MDGTTFLTGLLCLLLGLGSGFWAGRRLHKRRFVAASHEDTEELRRRLQRANRMESLGILSGSIMHNLNNMLSVIIGQARLARDAAGPDSATRHSLGQVIRASEAAAELSREIDRYQREIDQAHHPVRLQSVVRTTVKLLRDILPRSVQIDMELDAACGPVLASAAQVQQILLSLCNNAHHAMYRRHGRITITLATSEITETRTALPHDLEPGSYVELSVADNGRGMDAETLKRIFEPYFSARAPKRGAGLGLTMVSRLLAANESVIVPSSLPGHGSRFDIYFPLIARKYAGFQPFALADRPVEYPATTTDGRPSHGSLQTVYETPAAISLTPVIPMQQDRSVHVLLLEDDDMVAEMVCTCLERAGLQVTTIADGAIGVATFIADPGAFDMVLTDQLLYGLDGREVIAEVRRCRPRIPVVLMSGHPEGIIAEEVRRLGINGVLFKPFKPAQLIAAVRQAMKLEPRANEGRA